MDEMKQFIKKLPIIGSFTQRIYRKLFKRTRTFQVPQDDWTVRVEKINTIYGDFFSWKGDLISEQLSKYSAHTRNELAMIKTFISPGDNIIDIGAHIGTFSIPFSIFNKAQGTIFAFEANPENYNLLKINIVENGAGSFIIPYLSVVTNNHSAHKMFLPEGGNSGMYSFLRDKNASKTDGHCTNIDIWHNQNYKETPIHFIKIDVEGAEVSVLQSCQNLIEKYRPVLYIEINETALGRFDNSVEDIERLLLRYGYHFYKNVGARNSNNDLFELYKLINLKAGGAFFDFLAIHPSSRKYPRQTA